MRCVKPLSRQLCFVGSLLLTIACSEEPTTSDDCDDDGCESDSNASKDEDESEDEEDDDEEPSRLDAGGRDAGRGTSPTADSGRRDSGSGSSGSRDDGATTTPSGDAGNTSNTSDSSVPSVDAGGGTGQSDQTLPPISDYAAKGPFETTVEENVGPDNNYTIFRPEPLGEDGFLHSPIIFGPGILTEPCTYNAFLTHLASHGFVTISVNALGGTPGAQGNVDAMTAGLEWLIAQNEEAGDFQGKLAVDRAIAMGYSLGATASVQLSAHEAIMTTVAIHGHGTMGDPHGPVLLLTGTTDVIEAVMMTFSTLEEAPAVLMALPIGHLDVLGELGMDIFCGDGEIAPSTRYIAPITAWLRYWVNGDQEAKRFFWGADCEMCSDPWITPETNPKWDAQAL